MPKYPLLSKIDSTLIKHILVSLSYLTLAIGLFWWDWSAYSVLFSYLLEFILLLLVFFFSSVFGVSKTKVRYDPSNVLLGSLPLIIFNLGFISLMGTMDEDSVTLYNLPSAFLLEEVLPGSIIILVGYGLSLVNLSSRTISPVIDQNLFFQALCLTGINLLGVVIFVCGLDNKLILLPIMILLRVLMEWIFDKKMSLI